MSHQSMNTDSHHQNPKQYQRWYDKSPVLSQSVDTLTRFPQGIQSIIAEEMNEMAEERYDMKYKLKSLGKDKVLALHKAQNKRREYDKDPNVFKTFNYWYVLPDQDRLSFASQIMGTSSAVYQFLKVTRDYNHTFEERDLKRVIHTWIWYGEAKTAQLIDDYHERLRARAIEIEVNQKLTVQDDQHGMMLDHNIIQFRQQKEK